MSAIQTYAFRYAQNRARHEWIKISSGHAIVRPGFPDAILHNGALAWSLPDVVASRIDLNMPAKKEVHRQ